MTALAFSTMPMMSVSFMIRRSSPSILTSVPGPFAEQDDIAGLDIERDQLAAFVAGAWADGDDLAFLRLFLRSVGNDDPALGFHIAFGASDDDAVVKWPEFHWEFFLRPALRAATPPTYTRWHSNDRSAKRYLSLRKNIQKCDIVRS